MLIGSPGPLAAQEPVAQAQAAPASPAPAAAPSPATPPPTATSETLKILVLQGQNAVNSIRDGLVTEPVVEVHDENDQPLEGADVAFELPATGPGGSFPGGKFTTTVKSNLQGQAGATFMLNPMPGKFAIKVTASLRNRTGHATINQTNTLEGAVEKTSTRKISWWKVAVIGAAVGIVVGVVVATRGGSSSHTITLTPGAPTFGVP